MAITRKPTVKTTPPRGGVNVDALINKGGKPAKQTDADTTSVILRLPPDMLAQIDAAVAARPIRIPRHTWILEAIFEKLQR